MSENRANLVDDAELLVSVMGSWPTFHDAVILSAEHDGDRCLVSIHVFRVTDECDERGCNGRTDHHRVRLVMSGVSECSLPDEYPGDTLFGWELEAAGEFVSVLFDSAVDPDASWRVVCRTVSVRDVVPCDDRGRPAS